MSETVTRPPAPEQTYRERSSKDLLVVIAVCAALALILFLVKDQFPVHAAEMKPEPGATSMQVERAVEDLEEYLQEGYVLEEAVEAFNSEPLRTLTEATIYDGDEYIIHEPVIRDSISYGYAYDSATGEYFITDGSIEPYLASK